MVFGFIHRQPGSAGRRGARALAATTAALALHACGASAREAARPALAPAQTSCATAARTAAEAVGLVARRIYELELASPEVRADRRQVEGDPALLAALAGGQRAAVGEAVTRLVYSHTHIVRQRVSARGAVLADVGGPYVLAPVGGTLRAHGRTLGRYLLSVQDDLGYVKLETRYVGAPLILRSGAGRVPLEGTLPPSARSLPEQGPVSYRGRTYEAYSFDAQAFPSGRLRVTLLIAPPAGGLACAAVRVATLARIGERVWARFVTVSAPPSAYVHVLRGLTGALGYVRAGSRVLAAAVRPAPPRLPAAGSLRYRGVTYTVSSFAARLGGVRVRVFQLLVP